MGTDIVDAGDQVESRAGMLAGKMKMVLAPEEGMLVEKQRAEALEAYRKLIPLGVGLDFRCVGKGVLKEKPEGAMAIVVMGMIGESPVRHLVDIKLSKGMHPAMALAKLCDRAAKQLRILSKQTKVG